MVSTFSAVSVVFYSTVRGRKVNFQLFKKKRFPGLTVWSSSSHTRATLVKCERAQLFSFSLSLHPLPDLEITGTRELVRGSTWTGQGTARPDTSVDWDPPRCSGRRCDRSDLSVRSREKRGGDTGGKGGGEGKGVRDSVKSKAGNTLQQSNRVHFELRNTFPLARRALLWTGGSPGTVHELLCAFLFCISLGITGSYLV